MAARQQELSVVVQMTWDKAVCAIGYAESFGAAVKIGLHFYRTFVVAVSNLFCCCFFRYGVHCAADYTVVYYQVVIVFRFFWYILCVDNAFHSSNIIAINI